MHIRRTLGVLSVIALVVIGPAGGTQAQGQNQSLEKHLRELGRLHDEGLLKKDVYEAKLEELTSSEAGEDSSSPADRARDLGLPGLWQVRVEGLSLWAPERTLKRSIGMTFWELSATPGGLTLGQYGPEHGTYLSSDVSLAGFPFEETEISGSIVLAGLVVFELECVDGSAESFLLEQFSEKRIVGTYAVHDCRGGVRKGAPADRGRLILERLDDLGDRGVER